MIEAPDSTLEKKEGEEGEEGEEPLADTLGDREERAVAALLTRFKNLVSLTATPISEGATKEAAAVHAFQMDVESTALVRIKQFRLKKMHC